MKNIHFLCAALTVWRIARGLGKVREICGAALDIELDLEPAPAKTTACQSSYDTVTLG